MRRLVMTYSRHLALIISILVFLAMLTPLSSYAGITDELISAAINGDIVKIKSLIAKGADINAKDEYGWTAQHPYPKVSGTGMPIYQK